MSWFLVISILLFLTVFVQDVKSRGIWWFLPLVVFTTGLLFRSSEMGYWFVLWNIIFVAGILSFLWIYIRFRFGKESTFFSYFGLGDLLFLFALTTYFSFPVFIYVFTFGTCFSLLIHFLVNAIKKQETVPYAGYLSVFVLAILLFEKVGWINTNIELV
jgi:hypothetical protein